MVVLIFAYDSSYPIAVQDEIRPWPASAPQARKRSNLYWLNGGANMPFQHYSTGHFEKFAPFSCHSLVEGHNIDSSAVVGGTDAHACRHCTLLAVHRGAYGSKHTPATHLRGRQLDSTK
jgi:hypothetical protein